jgi:hypothetical protein
MLQTWPAAAARTVSQSALEKELNQAISPTTLFKSCRNAARPSK